MSSSDSISTQFSRSRSSGFLFLSLLFLFALVQILFLFPQNVFAVDVTLAWDANSEVDLAGYRVFYREDGQSYNYNVPDWEGNDTTCVIFNLNDHTTYYFIARAFDTSGNESGNSNEVCYKPSGNIPPVLDPIGPKTVDEGQLLEFSITASDPDGGALTYAAGNLPTGASFNPATQTFSWTPDYDDTGNYNVLFSVTDDGTPPQSDSETVTITVAPGSNLAPVKPVFTSPYYGQVECDVLLHVTTEPFSDPDGDSHSQSRWQISKQGDFSTLILDVTSTEHLTELNVPHAVLEADTTYFVRVQFYDAYLEPSGWSDTIEFTTTSIINDLDADGIPDNKQVGDDVDLNGDGIADIDQPEVIKCIQSSVGDATMGVCKISDSIRTIEAVETFDPSTISDDRNRPKEFFLELVSYRLSLNEPGAMATVRIYFSENISKSKKFYKYDTISGWEDFTKHTTFNEDGRSITVEVTDGGFGDSDGVANGIIVDPGALVEADVGIGTVTSDDDGSSSGGGCFIATAAFGSYVEPHVKLLRDFRDQCLLTNTPGTRFVNMYYRYGPFWADLINTHAWSKPVVRLALMPLVAISYVLTRASVATVIIAGCLLTLFVLGCFVRMHGRPVTGADQL